MNTYLNRWTAALGWAVVMLIVWALFVPHGVSVTTFVLIGMTGLLLSVFGSGLLKDSQPPRSVTNILVDLEAEAASSKPAARTR